MYRFGDSVYPSDLARRFLCRVVGAEAVRVQAAVAQILKLEPLEGPWPSGTYLIRLDDLVRRAQGAEQHPPPSRTARLRQPARDAAAG